jgi:hypothetical protein
MVKFSEFFMLTIQSTLRWEARRSAFENCNGRCPKGITTGADRASVAEENRINRAGINFARKTLFVASVE